MKQITSMLKFPIAKKCLFFQLQLPDIQDHVLTLSLLGGRVICQSGGGESAKQGF